LPSSRSPSPAVSVPSSSSSRRSFAAVIGTAPAMAGQRLATAGTSSSAARPPAPTLQGRPLKVWMV
jgi:hypothetical protein